MTQTNKFNRNISSANSVETDKSRVTKIIGDDNLFSRSPITKADRFNNEINIYRQNKKYIPNLIESKDQTIITSYLENTVSLEQKIKDKDTRNLEKLEENLIDFWGDKEELNWENLIQDFDSLIQKTEEIWNLDNWSQIEQKIHQTLTQHKSKITEIGSRQIHGDLWGNNILCKQDETDDTYLIDFEFSQKNTPLIDLSTFYLYSKSFSKSSLLEQWNIPNKLLSVFAIYRILWIFSNIDKESLEMPNQNYFHSFSALKDQLFEELFWLDQTDYDGQNNLLENHKVIQESESSTVKTVVVPVYEDKILTLKRKADDDFPNIWEFPGGRINPTDDSLLEGAKREFQEETGIEGGNWKFLYYHTFLEDSKIVFVAYYTTQIDQIPNTFPEHQSTQLLSKSETEQNLHFSNSKLVLQLL